MWYQLANALFRMRFAPSRLQWCDFRPHWNGYLVNAGAFVPSELDGQALHDAVYGRVGGLFQWVVKHRRLFANGDRLQILVWDQGSGTTWFRAWVPQAELSLPHPTLHDGYEYWSSRSVGQITTRCSGPAPAVAAVQASRRVCAGPATERRCVMPARRTNLQELRQTRDGRLEIALAFLEEADLRALRRDLTDVASSRVRHGLFNARRYLKVLSSLTRADAQGYLIGDTKDRYRKFCERFNHLEAILKSHNLRPHSGQV